MRIALFTLESASNARAVRRFVADHAADIALVGLSNPYRRTAGGMLGQLRRHLVRSGPGFLPYLGVNFSAVELSNLLGPLAPRDRPPEARPLAALCRDLGLLTMRVDDVNGPGVRERLHAARVDLIVSFHFDQIFRLDTLAQVPEGGVNLHPSLLPHHRGPTPTIHALAEEPPRFGVTIHRLDAAIDAGAVLAQEAVALPAGTTAVRAAALLHEEGRRLLDGVLASWPGTPRPQPGGAVPYCPFPSPSMLWRLWRSGRRLTDWRDLREALGVSLRAERR